ncbi:glucose 1-dehydrogenase [Paenibacillaceae bacterium]|nr:glucose 1-dehydrogenase [Paenibacillaceae bacterium]
MRFEGKIVIVTGSGKGIGRGIALEFAAEGAIVIIATLGREEGLDTESYIRYHGGKAMFIQTDVGSEDSIRSMVEKVIQVYGQIDVLVNNAGITQFKPMLEATVEDWDKVINIDLRGVFLCSKHTATYMVKQNKGAIVNISSNHALSTLPDTEIYAAAKAGVNGMTRSMALSLGKSGIRVNAICPGFTDTPHYRSWLQKDGNAAEVEQEVHFMHAGHRISTPQDIGKLALFLASDDAEMITGTEMLIDGGMSAKLYNSVLC